MTAWDDPMVVATLVAGVVGGAGAISYVAYDSWKNRLQVELERFQEKLAPQKSPTSSEWSIRVRPNKTIEHCKVSVGTVSIPSAKGGRMPFETKIVGGGAENFRIPTSVNPFGSEDDLTVI